MGAAVVKHRIQHDPDAPGMGLFHQLFQIGVGAKVGVHPGIIPGVVPVYRVRRKDGVEIQPADPQ